MKAKVIHFEKAQKQEVLIQSL